MLTLSTSHLWTKCALSASLSRGTGTGDGPFVPDVDQEASEAKREGIAADWVANGVLRGDASAAGDYLGETAPNGWVVTPDMVAHVQGYIDYCQSRGKVVQAQVPVNIPQLYIRGIVDSQIVADSSTLEIIDLKYGYRIVEALWNPQLLGGAIGLFDPEKHDSVRLTIYQPRPAHPDGKARSWEMDEQELTTAYQWLAGKASAALSPGAKGTPGGAYCRDCDGRGRCEALTTASYAAFDWVRGSAMTAMDARQLGDEMTFLDEALELIKARHGGVKAEVEGRMKRGEYIPGHAWDVRLGDREFDVPLEVVEEKTGIKPYKLVPMSPAELERAGADPDEVSELTTRRFAGRKLVRMTPTFFARMFPKPAKEKRKPAK